MVLFSDLFYISLLDKKLLADKVMQLNSVCKQLNSEIP